MITRNIVILPDPSVSLQAMEWSLNVARKYSTNFVLDGKKYYPHITLYQAAYPDDNVHTMETFLMKLVKNIKPFRVQAKDLSEFQGFLFLNIQKNDEIGLLQQKIFSVLGPLSKSLSPLAGELFVPHMTISKLRNLNDAGIVAAKLRKVDIQFDVHSIHLANIGPNGTVNEVFKEFPLQMV